jgi:hypothetical protein
MPLNDIEWRFGRKRKPKALPRVLFRRGRPASVRMKDELTTILEAVGAAQAELAAYLTSGDRNAELTIAKLIGILDRRDVVKAARLLRLSHGATAVPKAALAKAS